MEGRNSSNLMLKKISQFKAKDSEINDYALWLGTISNNFTINNMKKNEIKRKCKFFLVDLNPIDTDDMLDIHIYLIKKIQYEIMFGLIKKIFIGLLMV